MRCPACGGANLDDARFCCHCGVRIADLAHATPPLPPPPNAFRRLVTMGGADAHAIDLPMRGPKPRTLALAGAAIGAVGVAIGAAVAWRAARPLRHAPPAPSDRHVALIAVPRVLGADTAVPSPPVAVEAAAPSTRTPAVAVHARARPARAATTTTTPRRDGATSSGDPVAANDPPASPDDDPSASAPAPTATTTATNEHTDAPGTLDSSVIQSVYLQNRSQVEGCGLLLAGNSSNVGTVLVRVRLGATGSVVRAGVLSNTTGNSFLGGCVENTIRAWRYPAPQGGEVEFEYRFGFGT